jgi:hypothetical protein
VQYNFFEDHENNVPFLLLEATDRWCATGSSTPGPTTKSSSTSMTSRLKEIQEVNMVGNRAVAIRAKL